LKAAFLDRDGVINEFAYFPEVGVIDSPLVPRQFRLMPDAGEAIRILNNSDIKVIVVSNQPGIAKGKMTVKNFEKIRQKMKRDLRKEGANIDAEYYCLHHPEAPKGKYRQECECRKPKPGLLLEAAKQFGLSLAESFMIGDSLTDIEAGKAAGCTTILVGNPKCDLCKLMEEKDMRPDFSVPNFLAAAKVVLEKVK
jgi:D-glycero-D-manno-heptose 1,7-bisphosphate phosphatase